MCVIGVLSLVMFLWICELLVFDRIISGIFLVIFDRFLGMLGCGL